MPLRSCNAVAASRRTLVAAVLALALVAGCGDDTTENVEAADQLIEVAKGATANASVASPLDDLRTVVGSDTVDDPWAEAVVVGEVVAAAPGAAYREESPGSAVSEQVPFDDATAQWRTIELTFAVDEVLRGDIVGDELTVGFTIGGDVDEVGRGFAELGRLVLPIYSGSPVFDHREGVWSIVGDGQLLMTVADDGSLAMPFAEDGLEDVLLRSIATIDVLRDVTRSG
mgnify:CR=1 FL=1